jgi:phosphoribosylglycinamide formyltransferase 1
VPSPSSARVRLAVLVSGSGTNLQAVLDAAKRPGSRLRVACVLSNRPGVKALDRARAAGVDALVEDHTQHETREHFERALLSRLMPYAPDVVVLAGFMRVLTGTFIGAFERRIVNVHPALLPSFPGMHAARQALDAGVRITGCTVHLVDTGVDTGPVLAQAAVPILDGDDEGALQQRIQAQEHRLLPRVVEAMAQGDVVVRADGSVRVLSLSPEASHLGWH